MVALFFSDWAAARRLIPCRVRTLAKRGVTDTGRDDSVLDKAFALIEGFWEFSQRTYNASWLKRGGRPTPPVC
jgi:hypothetical protein